MRALIDLIIHYKHWFVFLLLEVISLFFLFSHKGYQRSVYFTTANDVVGSAYNVISSITSYLHLKEKNQELESTNEQLHREIYQMRQQLTALQQDTLRRMPELPSIYDVQPAQVVNMTLHKANNLITINKGEADGIRPEMGVICSQGVIGIVYMTSQHYSIVMPLLNVNSKISCRLRGSDYFGSLVWQRGYANIAYVTSVPRHAPVKKGDIVETNGYSDIFPPGLPIGIVQRVGDSPDGMSYFLRVKLHAPFATLREVSVIMNYSSPERRILEKMAEDPLKQDSVLIQQEKMKEQEEQKKRESEERERTELERIKQQLEQDHASSTASTMLTNETQTNADTIK